MRNAELIHKLERKGLTLGSVESITGGLFAATICAVPGASNVFKGALVTYSNELKKNLAQVSNETIEKHGVISGQCARDMAVNGLQNLGVEVCVSFTGNAGPTMMEDKPAGLVYIGLSILNKMTIVQKYRFVGERNQVRELAVAAAIELVLDHLVDTK
ncbi:MAG: CinA family protein [Bacilli bacterium]|jgi:nicotinamide-nucleotide amidase|nr:CinA family protein [Bacilli bacterium]MDD3389129.1 CinA family protein [Bacilli bacterium]MDD4344773.1 CinA family protein [Bacilli bacterium]MDD4520903.1 CinA family protein [Bacilli bacterium]MDY0399580.1 CinA family protein [Bacilli bacterium]